MPEWFDIPCECGEGLKDPIHCAEETLDWHEYRPVLFDLEDLL